jgi:hypothetical protein
MRGHGRSMKRRRFRSLYSRSKDASLPLGYDPHTFIDGLPGQARQ